MDDLQFRIEWLEADEIAGPELQATWCRLQILLNGRDLIDLLDERTQSVRKGIYLPAYVLAEWFVDRYHFLLQEYPRAAVRESEYSYRHDLLYNREGYLFPGLRIYPIDRRTIAIEVTPVSYESERKRFLTETLAYCDRSAFESGLRRFMNAVTARLEDRGIHETYLARRWQEWTECDKEERQFVEITAALGKHYAGLTAQEEQGFLEISDGVPEDVIQEIVHHLTFEEYLQQFRLLSRFTMKMQASADRVPRLQEIRTELLGKTQWNSVPWEYGYTLARSLRTMLQTNATVFGTVEDIHRLMGMGSTAVPMFPVVSGVYSSINAVIVSPTQDRFNLALRENIRASSRIFSYCRALGEYFNLGEKKVSVVSSIESWGQQMNRAFAAEFLVPVQLLQERIAESSVHAEQIDTLAEEFHVSSRLIRHQLGNQTSIKVIEED
jgi:hypothetical protein